ncbi:MAG: hypothetical protein JW893_07760 [Candidatus Omnitrophica bacterium]|nr:hypothetical protein [Candidatus Omnitrophota bacterium]
MVLVNVLVQAKAFAYLDPGSGSYLIQIILAGLLAASFTIKAFWKNVKDFFRNLLSKGKPKEK